MANLLIKPTTGSGNKIIIQDQAGGDILTSADSGATIENATFPTVKLTPTATASAPTGVEGALYYDSDKKSVMYYDGTAWLRVSQTKLPGISKSYSGSFDGTDDYIDVSNNAVVDYFQAHTNHTMSAWFKADTAETACIFSLDDDTGWHHNNLIYTKSGGVHGSYVASGDICSTSYPMTYVGAWHHAVMTVTHSNSGTPTSGTSIAKLYIDGEERSSSGTVSTTTITNATDYGTIGKYHIGGDSHISGMTQTGGSPGYHFDGLITEVSTWNTALSSSEVEAIYNLGTPIDLSQNNGGYGASSSLTAWWRTENNANDSGSNGWNGSASGVGYPGTYPS